MAKAIPMGHLGTPDDIARPFGLGMLTYKKPATSPGRHSVSMADRLYSDTGATRSTRNQWGTSTPTLGDAVTTEENRRIITEMFARWSSGDVRAFSEALADDVSLTTVGSTKYSATFVGNEEVVVLFTPFRGTVR